MQLLAAMQCNLLMYVRVYECCRDFEARCNQITASMKKEGSGATGKRDLTRLSHWFESFSERTGKPLRCTALHCTTSQDRLKGHLML